MPRELTFRIGKKEYAAVPEKIDRKKLYGWVGILALDEEGRPCRLITTDQSGTLLIPTGGTGMAVLSSSGDWVDKSELVTVKDDGSPATIFPSSYSVVTSLDEHISLEEFLDYSITDFYLLQADEGMRNKIGDRIYRFEYSYLDSYEPTTAFLLVADDELFMLLGYENRFEMLCLGDCEAPGEPDDDYIDVTDDDIDFSMF